MGVVVFLVIVAVVLGALGLFWRSVFGGSTFRPERRRDRDAGGRRGPPPDAHAGSSRWPGGGSIGTFGQWGVGSGGAGDSGGSGSGS